MTTRATRGPRRRTVVALGVVLAVLAAFVVRLVDIQIVNADEHVTESIGQLGEKRVIAGQRGNIVDENGKVLASSVLVYDAQLDPMLIKELEKDPKKPPKILWAEASEKIAEVTGQSVDDVRAIVNDALQQNEKSRYAVLKKSLNTEQYMALRDLRLPYLAMPARETRVYPNGAVAGNLVGFVDAAGEGQFGIEQMEAECLQATDGEESYLRSPGGVRIPGSQRTVDAVDGGSVKLTINSDLQWYLQQMIAEETQKQQAKSGTAFVVEVKTGKIRAAAEYPSMDPNDLDASDKNDRGNRVFTKTFEPGSTFKAITAAAAMEGAGLTPLSTVQAGSYEEFPNGARIKDAFNHPVYSYTLAGALIDSSNVALSKFGTMIEPQVLHDYLQDFGVGEKTIGFPREEPGVLHPITEWDNQSKYTMTFGQHYTVTVPQVAGAYQAIANGGEKTDLSLIESCLQVDGTVVEPEAPESTRVITEQTAADLTRMLENVAVQGGLAQQIAVPGYRITSKTGTAEVPGANNRYKTGIYETSMVGFAPVEDPEYVVMVTLSEPTRITSSAATASAFQKAMTQVLKTYRVTPSSLPMDELLPKFD